MASRNIDLLFANPRRSASNVGIAKMRVTRNTARLDSRWPVAPSARRRRPVAERSKPGGARAARRSRGGPTRPRLIADRRANTQLASACSVAAAVDGKNRPHRIRKHTGADGRDRKDPTAVARNGPRRRLLHRASARAGRRCRRRYFETDLHLSPFLGGQIDRERPEAGLHVGQKENEPVEAALAFAQGAGGKCSCDGSGARRNIAGGGGSLAAIVVNPIDGGERPGTRLFSLNGRIPTAATCRPRRAR